VIAYLGGLYAASIFAFTALVTAALGVFLGAVFVFLDRMERRENGTRRPVSR
jgi:hypothetical protein